MNTRCPPKRVPSATRFFKLCRLTVQPPQSYSVRGQRSSGQLTGKPAGARPDYRGRWCALPVAPSHKKKASNNLCLKIVCLEAVRIKRLHLYSAFHTVEFERALHWQFTEFNN
ncbi:UNVERIFIED_CONTAM: hypothetical protein FKN15_013946 [Acipenser sinensis]